MILGRFAVKSDRTERPITLYQTRKPCCMHVVCTVVWMWYALLYGCGMHCCMDVVCTVVWMWHALVYALFCMPCCRLCMWYALLYALLLTSSRREDGFSCRHGFKPPLTHCVCCMPCCMYVVCTVVCLVCMLYALLYVCGMP